MFKFHLHRSREATLLYAILVFSVVLLVLVAALVNKKFRETSYNFQKVHEGHLVINNIRDIEATLTATGTSVRSYLIVRDAPTYTKLPQYHKEVIGKVDQTEQMLSSYPDQYIYVDSLRQNVESRFDIWRHLISIDADSLQKVDKALMLQNTMIMQDILNECAAIRNHENKIVEDHINETQAGIKMTSIMALFATLLCVGVIVFALVRLNGEVKHGMIMQTELKRKVHELDRSNADLERFAYVASHDLHEPLRKLYAFSEILMEREKNISPESQEIIHRMHAFVTRMQRLIDDMLEFSLNFNKVEKKVTDANQLVKNAMNNLAVNISESKADISTETLPVNITGFDSQLSQLFQNIISNSIKYSREGVPPQIHIMGSIAPGSEIDGAHPDDVKKKFHKIIFSDNGIGFDNKYKEKIFVIFQRLHGKSEYDGTGIGLATCKRVIENHSGYISATGEEGKGAIFTIYLPTT